MAPLDSLPPLANDLEGFLNKKVLIIGEVGSGKTAYTRKILKKILESVAVSVAVIDMAPEAKGVIGGKINMSGLEGAHYYTTTVHPPRLMGKSPHEVQLLASENAARIEKLFDIYRKDPARTLCINDISLYLQAGDLEKLWTIIEMSSTTVMNGYYGTTLGGGELGDRERRNMEKLCDRCDAVLRLELRD